MEASQLRERITRWIEDSKELFTLLPELPVAAFSPVSEGYFETLVAIVGLHLCFA